MIDTEAYDPFGELDRALGAGRILDPYPGFEELRRQGPVARLDLETLRAHARAHGMPRNVVIPPSSLEVYAVLSHEAVSRVLRDGRTFSSRIYAATMGVVMGETILQLDEPEHAQRRGLIQQAFTRGALRRWETQLVAPIVRDRIDAFAARGRADLVRELTFPFPVQVIAGMIGLPSRDLPRFHRWAVELISVGFDWERGVAASRAMAAYFRPLLEERRRAPRDDLMSVLVHAELEGKRLPEDEILAFLRLLAPAGAETTYRASSNLLAGLLSHPEQLEAVRRDRSRVPAAIEEALRWEPPLTGIVRVCTRDTEVCGVKIPEGAIVQVILGAANRDPTRFAHPSRFDIQRPPRPHLAFAFGPHRCLGMHLARMEMRVALCAVLDRLSGLRLDPDAGEVQITGQFFRSPARLPVLFDA
ncbi:MAG: cytochrome P450 [Myxococcota bacterium]